MLALVPVWAEGGTVLASGLTLEALGQAQVWGWAEHPARQRLGIGAETLPPSLDAGCSAQMTATPFLFSLSDLYGTIARSSAAYEARIEINIDRTTRR